MSEDGAKQAPPQSFPPGVGETIDWLQARFARHYREQPAELPDRFTRREFGFILWPDRPGPPPFIRHRAYTDSSKLAWYMGKRGPHSAYYSTAYYRHPGEKMMVDKEWLGAELIFDLDADHLDEAEAAKARGEEMPLEEQLKIVKTQFRYLLDEFLFGDFGLDEKEVFLTFSGGRGYHAHVTDPRLMALDSKGRREIVDYVTAKVPSLKGSSEPDLSGFITEKPVGTKGMGKFARAHMAEYVAPVNAPGWPGRLTRGLVSTLQTKVLDAPAEDARKWLVSLDGVGGKTADQFIEEFDAAALERVSRGFLEQGPVAKKVSHHVLRQSALALGKGETDEPVTADVKRLIRLPGSLHGKTGLRVVTLGVDELKEFDPFRDATVFGEETVRMIPRFDQKLTLAGVPISATAGEEIEVPVNHAVFWCSRQAGTVVRAVS
jgi:DNA primase small subunit